MAHFESPLVKLAAQTVILPQHADAVNLWPNDPRTVQQKAPAGEDWGFAIGGTPVSRTQHQQIMSLLL